MSKVIEPNNHYELIVDNAYFEKGDKIFNISKDKSSYYTIINKFLRTNSSNNWVVAYLLDRESNHDIGDEFAYS